MIQIDGKYYIIDIDKLMSWIVESPNSERNINTVTTMTYPITNDGEEIIEKEVSESKSTLNEIMNNIRYDFIKNLFSVLFTAFTNDMNQIINTNISDWSFAQKIAFNTLLHKKIIIELNDNEND